MLLRTFVCPFVVAAACCVGCLYGAESETTLEPAAIVAPELSGRWSGQWSSSHNGHNGPMHATFERVDSQHYQVHFNGRFWKLIPFKYTAVLTVTGVDAHGRVLLAGSHRLGPVLGTFSYNAWASDTQFVAGYCSEKDHGQFTLTRVCR